MPNTKPGVQQTPAELSSVHKAPKPLPYKQKHVLGIQKKKKKVSLVTVYKSKVARNVYIKTGMVAQAYNPRACTADTGGSQVWIQDTLDNIESYR